MIAGGVTITLAWMQNRTKQSVDKNAKVTEDVHALVNSNFGVQLKVNEVLARRVADLTQNKADVEAADLAARLHREHMEKQSEIDGRIT